MALGCVSPTAPSRPYGYLFAPFSRTALRRERIRPFPPRSRPRAKRSHSWWVLFFGREIARNGINEVSRHLVDIGLASS